MLKDFHYCVVGSGLSGLVFAERITSCLDEPVLLVEKRGKVGGNCSSTIDAETGIEIHDYGSHIFHTEEERVWNYIRKFGDFTSYHHRVLINSHGKVYFMPINLKTISEFTGRIFSPAEAEEWIRCCAAEMNGHTPANLEEKAISLIGRPLYETFIAGYTQKQWGRSPRELPADIITRLPVRTTYNTDYFNAHWQGIPAQGYQTMFEKMLSHPNIRTMLDTSFQDVRQELAPDCKIIYTGMIDEFFNYQLGHLEWRSLRFETERIPIRDYQGAAVLNYGDMDVPYTRIHEFKHYHPEWKESYQSPGTIICREYPHEWRQGMEAYYPVNDARNGTLLQKYQELAKSLPNIHFCGRLASYRYWDMDKAIAMALEGFDIMSKYGDCK